MGNTLTDTEWFYAQNVSRAIDRFITAFEEKGELSILRESVENHEPFPSGVVQQQRELFTKRTLIEPLFEALGYEGVTKEPADLMPDERKRPDYCIDNLSPLCACIAEIKPLGLLSLKSDSRNTAEEQARMYLQENTLAKYRRDLEVTYLVGIATDGLIWSLYAKKRGESHIEKIEQISIARVFAEAIRARQYPDTVSDDWRVQERDFIEAEFAPVFAQPSLVERVEATF